MIKSNLNTILRSSAYFAPRLFVCVRFTLQTLATPPGTTSGQVLSQDSGLTHIQRRHIPPHKDCTKIAAKIIDRPHQAND